MPHPVVEGTLRSIRGHTRDRGFRFKMGMLLVSHVFNDGYGILLTPILPLIAAEFGLDTIQMGLIVSVNWLSTTLLQLPSSFVADFTGRKKTLLASGLLILGIGVLLYGFSFTYWLLLVASLLVGIGGSFYHPTSMAIITDELPRERKGFYLGIHTPAGSMGASLLPALAGLAVTWTGWRQAAVILAVPVIILSVLTYFLLGTSDTRAAKDKMAEGLSWTRLSKELLSRALLTLAVVGGLSSFTYYGAITFLPLWVQEVYRWNSAMAGGLMALFHGTALVSQPLLGYLSDRIERSALLRAALGVCAGAIILLSFLPGIVMLLVSVALWGAAVLAVRPLLFAAGTDRTSSAISSSTIGLLFTINTAFGSLSPLVGGMLVAHFSFKVAFSVYAASVLAGMLLVSLSQLMRDSR